MSNAKDPRHAAARSDDAISECECDAMQRLDDDPAYSRSEIAFMFECQAPTVARHCDEQCRHCTPAPTRNDTSESNLSSGRPAKYDTDDCRAAFEVVNDEHDYQIMSQQLYEELRPSIYPSANTIIRAFGSWPEARREITGGDQ